MLEIRTITLNKLRPEVKLGMFGATSELWGHQLDFQRGENILLKSGSGRGKTSAIAFLYGLRRDYSGSIHFDGHLVSTFPVNDWSQLRRNALSVVFQDLRLFRQLTAFENVMLKNTLNPGVSEEEILNMFEEFGIGKLTGKRISHMSFGEQQRVAIIRALVQPFSFLLMDEPFSHLDKHNISIAVEMILRACRVRESSLVMTSLGDHYSIDFSKVIEV
ncbi:MAG: ATP-binding cassette domain-containing protein [Bacteroidales bacterium]